MLYGVRSGAVSWFTTQQARRVRNWLLIGSLRFFIDLILPTALWPWSWLSL